MGDLSRHFSRREFACRCGCGQDTVDAELVTVLQRLRDHFAKPVLITSGNRCAAHNRACNGAPNSLHRISRAADVRVGGVPPEAVYVWLDAEYPACYGLGRYTNWVHIDTRQVRARW
jgi:uncharacterized protein YcbK (DUF882 family)